MLASYQKPLRAAFLIVSLLGLGLAAGAQSAGSSTSVTGVVLDPTGAVVPGVSVEIHNPVSGFARTAITNATGNFYIPNVPFNPYHLSATGKGFAAYSQDIDVRSVVPVAVNISLKVGTSETVTVEAGAADLLENDPTFHTDVDRGLFDKLPLESQSSSVSSLVTLATPGIAADSNGLFHGLGDHAENSFSLDGQPITDQQSKVFSNQIPLDAVESMEVISGAPPAQYGDKTSVVINVTTRSGQGMATPHGSVTGSYGSFGSSDLGFNLGYGGQKWGNFISASGLNSGRFLDPSEFAVMHDKGNEENIFDRVDYQFSTADTLHLNLGLTRSWFQTPNSYDSELATPWNGVIVSNSGLGPDGLPVGATDQRSQIKTFNIAPSWTRLINNQTVFTLGAYVRRDAYDYYPSANPFADLGAPGLQSETVSQHRTLTNAGLRSDLSYVKGIHNIKGGAVYSQTFLDEKDPFGIVDPTLNAPCLDSSGNPYWNGASPSSPNDTSQCAGLGLQPNDGVVNPNLAAFNPLLGCYDLTRPSPFLRTTVRMAPLLAGFTPSTVTPTSNNLHYTSRIRSPKEAGRSTWACGGTSTTASPRTGKANPAWVSPTTLSVPAACFVFHTRALWRARSTKTWCSPMKGAATPCSIPCLPAPVPASTHLAPAGATSFTPDWSRPLADILSSPASTSGSTPTTLTTSAYWAPHPLLSPSSGITPRFRDTQAG